MLLALRAAGAGFEGDPLDVVRDAGAGDRLFEVADRRGPVVGVSVLVWLVALALALAVGRARAGRTGARVGRASARLLAPALVYLPLVLLLGSALEPGVDAERLLVMLGAPALAAVTLATSGGYRALAFACAATVLAHAIDLLAGSSLIQLSLAGPNPAAGHRYYGIGNELEAILVVLVLGGTGAALSAPVCFTRPTDGKGTPEGAGARMRGAGVFLAVSIAAAFVFAYGRYGADVGAAIALPLGGAVAAALLLERPRLAWLAVLLPLPAVALLAVADLLSGADAHLTGSVLGADSSGDALAVLGRRLREAGESFGRPLLLVGLPFVLGGVLVAWLRRDLLAAWLRPVPALRAGLAGATAAILVATVANDSGALLLELGAVYIAAFLAFAWAENEDDRTGRSGGP